MLIVLVQDRFPQTSHGYRTRIVNEVPNDPKFPHAESLKMSGHGNVGNFEDREIAAVQEIEKEIAGESHADSICPVCAARGALLFL